MTEQTGTGDFEIELDDCVTDPDQVDWTAYSDANLMVSAEVGTPGAVAEAKDRGLL